VKHKCALSAAVCLLWAASLARAAEPGTSQESQLLWKIYQINQMEIQVGNLAKSKGSTYKVREYGGRLVRDHTMADNNLMKFARIHGIMLQTGHVESSGRLAA
jgi:predicted outer membrane protein